MKQYNNEAIDFIMNKIVNINYVVKIAKTLRKQNKTIVVVGGFFDILHIGHIKFLMNAKKVGDYLFVLLEDDKRSREIKGEKRPINSQNKRASLLSSLESVDYVITLKNMTNNKQYDRIINRIAPDIIATTYPDPNIMHKIRQAKLVNAKIKYVLKRISRFSTTKLEKLIK